MNSVLRITESKEFAKYINKIRLFLADLVFEYPLHDVWFEGVVTELVSNRKRQREILFITNSDDEIIGVSILKNTNSEKKICTLRVAKKSQGKGIGTLLVNESCKLLGTNKPIITVSQSKHKEFISLFKKFHFNLERIYYGKYNDMSVEYCYNGILLPESILKKEDIVDKKELLHYIA